MKSWENQLQVSDFLFVSFWIQIDLQKTYIQTLITKFDEYISEVTAKQQDLLTTLDTLLTS